MFIIDSCAASGTAPLRHYGRARPANVEQMLLGPSPYLKLRAIYPYFVRQQTDASCSLASITTLLNAARASSLREPLTQNEVLLSDASGVWSKSIADRTGDGVDLSAMALHVMQTFHAHVSKRVTVDVRRMGRSRVEFTEALMAALIAGEQQPQDNFIVINVLQSKMFADGEAIGHMSVVGAYDNNRREVLVLDVGNRDLMPYWVSIDQLVDAMNTADDVTGEQRGYILIRR